MNVVPKTGLLFLQDFTQASAQAGPFKIQCTRDANAQTILIYLTILTSTTLVMQLLYRINWYDKQYRPLL
jgi:hypothetical protein